MFWRFLGGGKLRLGRKVSELFAQIYRSSMIQNLFNVVFLCVSGRKLTRVSLMLVFT